MWLINPLLREAWFSLRSYSSFDNIYFMELLWEAKTEDLLQPRLSLSLSSNEAENMNLNGGQTSKIFRSEACKHLKTSLKH